MVVNSRLSGMSLMAVIKAFLDCRCQFLCEMSGCSSVVWSFGPGGSLRVRAMPPLQPRKGLLVLEAKELGGDRGEGRSPLELCCNSAVVGALIVVEALDGDDGVGH